MIDRAYLLVLLLAGACLVGPSCGDPTKPPNQPDVGAPDAASGQSGGQGGASGGIAGATALGGSGGAADGPLASDGSDADDGEGSLDGAGEAEPVVPEPAKDAAGADFNTCISGCIPPLVCIAGRCACQDDRSWCAPDCVDTKTDKNHCGSCRHACGADELCTDGTCVGATASDGCGNAAAGDLTLQQIAVYQSIKIPIMADGNELAPAARIAKVVKGRETLVRAFVTVGATWSPREIAARLTLVSQEGRTLVFSTRQQLAATSQDAELSSSFQFFVPAEVVSPGATYSVELVECDSATGTVGRSRFPDTGTADLGVVSAGGIKITVIPIQVGDFLPDTSNTGLASYASELMAMYPIDDVTFTVGDTLTTTDPVDWESMLEDVRNKRATDAPSPDVYYFGLVKPATSFWVYCLLSCTTGIGYVVTNNSAPAALRRVAIGVGFADLISTSTMAHELGHNHGRGHAPCVTGGDMSAMTGIDPDFPYSNGGVGVWGYDRRTRSLVDPATATDIMGYCKNQWISDYTYTAITDRIRLVNGAAMVYTPAAARGRWWLMDIDSKGAHWGLALDQETAAEGEPEPAVVYGRTGEVVASVVVYRSMMSNGHGSMVMVPAPEADWDTVAVRGAPPLSFAAPMRTYPRAR